MSAADGVAVGLSQWFREGRSRYEEVTKSLAGGDQGRSQLFAHGAIERSANKLLERREDEDLSFLFSSTCIFLGAASQFLGLRVTAENWKAAIENVLGIERQLSDAQAVAFGIPDSASALFLSELGTQLDNAGFARVPSVLNQENRRRALALAINFGLRFLIAIGLEGGRNSDPAYLRFTERLKPLQAARSAT